MRPKGVLLLLVVVALVAAGFYFFSDGLVERSVEDAGSGALGARVEIDDLDLNLTSLAISMARLQVANPNDTWKNLFETGRLAFNVDAAQLLRKKLVVEEVTIADVRVGTRRTTDGKIERTTGDSESGWFADAKAGLKRRVADAPVLHLGILKQKINVDSLVAAFDLQAPGKIDSARADAAATFAKWETTLSEFDVQKDLDTVAAQVEELKSADTSNLKDALSAAEKAKKILSTLDRLKKAVAAKKKAATADFNRLGGIVSQADNWLAEDFNAVSAKARLGDFNAQNVGKMLFGDAVVQPLLQALSYIDLARRYMPVVQKLQSTGKVEKPPRFQGQDIDFPLLDNRPKFLLENILLSAAGNQQDTRKALRISGQVHGLTSQPRVYGQPTTFELTADAPGSNAYHLSGELDHTADIASDRFQIKATGVRVGNISLPEKPYLPGAIVANQADVRAAVSVIGDSLSISLSFAASPVTFEFAGAVGTDPISRVTRSVFSSVSKLTLAANIAGPVGAPRLSIHSNIDDILAKRIKGLIGESARVARDQIRQRLEAEVLPRKREALAFVNENKARLVGKLDGLKAQIDKYTQVVEEKKRAVTARAEKEKNKGLKTAGDKLKGLFKKKKN